MQEAAGPQWDPISINHVAPWEIRLFVVYLLFVLVFFLVRVTQLGWFLWRSRKSGSPLPGSEVALGATAAFLQDLALASIRSVSLKRSAVLTTLLSLAVSAEQAATLMRSISVEKVFGPAAFAGSGSEMLSALALGIGVCVVLYAAFAMFDGKLSRIRLRVEHRP